MSDAGYLYALSVEQGFKLWRRHATSGGVVLRRAWPKDRVRAFRAFRDEHEIGSWSTCDWPGGQTSGHVRGDYSQVQGPDAPCVKLADWLAQIGIDTSPDEEQLGLDLEAAL